MTLGQFDTLSASERDYWIADWQIARQECPDCHRPAEECSDPERRWYPYRRVCYVTMERQAAQDAYDKLHEERPWHNGTFTSWQADRSDSHPYHANAGVSFGIADRDVAPHDKFTTDENASPVEDSALEGS